MKITLHKYIFQEIWPPLVASLVVFVFIVLAARIINISEWVVNHGVHPSQMARMISYLIPGMILFALPASTLMAVFIAFHRLSGDNEIQALKASGISLYQMLPSAVLISALCFGSALFISHIVELMNSLLATEFDTEPSFVTFVILAGTLISPLTLTPLLSILGA